MTDDQPLHFGDGVPFIAILPVLYEELRCLAEIRLADESAGHTLQPTALVNEVYLRMAAQDRARICSREQFFAIAAETMRRILVDHARSKLTRKRGRGFRRVTLREDHGMTADGAVDVLALELALHKLEQVDEVLARVVLLRFYGGLTEREVGATMGRSERWVRKQWTFGKAWLRRELGAELQLPDLPLP